MFTGCNVENRFFPATICAERNAMTAAVAAGYRRLLQICLCCKKYQGPGASACGVCRQVLLEFGADAEMFNMADLDSNVRRFKVVDLLPAAAAVPVPFDHLPKTIQLVVRALSKLKARSYVPYSKEQRAALVVAANTEGLRRAFRGVSDDNSSYGASALAECVAMRSARTAGFTHDVMLAVTVDDPSVINPIDGECLQVLREFGAGSQILLVGNQDATNNRSNNNNNNNRPSSKNSSLVVHSSVDELLPDSFGPEALA